MKRLYDQPVSRPIYSQHTKIRELLQDDRKRKWELGLIFNAIFYVVKTGIQWRMLPVNFPPWPTVYWYFKKWQVDGSWELLHAELYRLARQRAGKPASASAAIRDCQTVKTDFTGGVRGFDAGKKIKGRKRHILVDTLGFLLVLVVHRAAIQDRKGAVFVFNRLLKNIFAFLRWKVFYADGGYSGKRVDWVAEQFKNLLAKMGIIKRANQRKAFQVLPKRWIVERTFAWLGFHRRLSKDYERQISTSESFIKIAMLRLMLNRI